MTGLDVTSGAREAVYGDALAAARRLKRQHAEFHRTDPKAFRDTVRKACNRVLRIKPGPKPARDPRLGAAARERGRGGSWPELYVLYIDHHKQMTEFTRGLAEDSFRRKVNQYLRDHPRLKLPKRIPVNNATAEPAR